MERNHLQFPLQVGNDELLAYRVILGVVGRRRAVAAFMAAKGVTCAMVAAQIGRHGSRPSQFLSSDSAPGHLVENFKSLGFPAFLLPEPRQGRAA